MGELKNENLKISIIMPVYNAALFLAETLDSIISQKEENWELICIDDYSSDRSYEILNDYKLKDARIIVLSNTEKGIIPALNLALNHSTGDLITRMDADDIMHPRKLFQLKKIY